MTDQHPFWHPFADMSRAPGRDIVLDRGQGAWLQDVSGRRYLDATAGLWFANIGHGRGEIADAVATQTRRLAAYSTFDVYANRPALELAEKLAAISPMSETAVFFTSGGSDSVDTAAKIARRYWQVRGKPERTVMIARSQAYHGMHGFGTSLAGIASNADGWGSIVADVVHVAHDDLDELAVALEQHDGHIAAFIGEPVIGAGGVLPPAEDYWTGVEKLCRERDVLLIADEVVTGYGRLGTWFACERYNFMPDMITSAKGLTSGYLPLGAVLVGARVREVLWSPQAGVFRHGYTYSGHAVCCRAALANLDIIEREGLLQRVNDLTPILAHHLNELDGHPVVEETRSAGLLGAIQLSMQAAPSRMQAVDLIVERLRERGILLRGLLGHSLQISPPFVISEEELSHLFTCIKEELDRLEISGRSDG